MIKNIFKYSIGFSIIIFIFWTRFLRDRSATPSLIFEHVLFEYIKIIFITTLILYFFFSFIKSIKKIFDIKKQSYISIFLHNNKYFIELQNIIYDYIIDAPNYLYIKLTEKRNIKPLIEQPASYFTAYLYYPRTFVFTLLMFPRAIVATMFVFSLFYFKNMTYFYYSLNLLIPLLLFKVFVYIVTQFSRRYLDTIETLIIFEEIYEPEGYLLKVIPEENYKDPNFSYDKYLKQFPVYCDLWQIYTRIHNYMRDIQYEQDAMSPYVQCYTSLCYILCWLYILFNNIF